MLSMLSVILLCVCSYLLASPVHAYSALHLVHLHSEKWAHRCGNGWQASVASIQAHALSTEAGTLLDNLFVSVSLEAGLADRLTGTVTQFLIALLVGRAFKVRGWATCSINHRGAHKG